MPTTLSIAKQNLINGFFRQLPDDAALVLNSFPVNKVLHYLNALPVNDSKEIFSRLNPDVAAEVIEKMDKQLFIQIFSAIDGHLGARLLSRLDKKEIKKKLSLLPSNLEKELSEFMSYPPESAGDLMDTRVTTFNPDNTVEEVLTRLRTLPDRKITNVYIVDETGSFKGLVPLQIIAISGPEKQMKSILQAPLGVINAMAPRDEVVEVLEGKKIIHLPVTDINNKLLGVIRNDALLNATREEATEDLQAMFGAGREERALSKVSFAVKKRLPWLQINLATAFLASSVVGLFEETIAQITILAVFLPVVAGQSGNTGSQALAVTMRGLALREVRIGQWFRVARKELSVGFINGVAVALVTSLIVFFWASSFGLALVIAISMIFSMTIAGLSGAVIPIILQSIGQDPAQSSSIILTTVTDVFGFFSFLGLATLLSSMIGVA